MENQEFLQCFVPYFAHRLEFVDIHTHELYEVMALYDDSINLYSESLPSEMFYLDGSTPYFKPLLIPLSELIEKLADYIQSTKSYFEDYTSAKRWLSVMILESDKMPYYLVQKIFELHGDLHGLIEKGLALNKQKYGK